MDSPEVDEKILEATKSQVNDELEEYISKQLPGILDSDRFRQLPEEILEQAVELTKQRLKAEFLNNFSFHFPVNTPETQHLNGFSYYTDIVYKAGYWDRCHKDLLAEIEREGGRVIPHSAIYLNQTGREFYETIDQVTRQEGISQEDLDSESERFGYSNKNFNLIVFPVYVRMRALGYTHQELTG